MYDIGIRIAYENHAQLLSQPAKAVWIEILPF